MRHNRGFLNNSIFGGLAISYWYLSVELLKRQVNPVFSLSGRNYWKIGIIMTYSGTANYLRFLEDRYTLNSPVVTFAHFSVKNKLPSRGATNAYWANYTQKMVTLTDAKKNNKLNKCIIIKPTITIGSWQWKSKKTKYKKFFLVTIRFI